MQRIVCLAIVVSLLSLGCGRNPEQVSSNANAPQAQGNSSNSASQEKPVSESYPDEASPDEKLLYASVGTMMHTANQLERFGEYDKALQTWELLRKKLVDEFGVDAWQVRNVDLAIDLSKRRSELTLEERTAGLNIAALERDADDAVQAGRLDKAVFALHQALPLSNELWGPDSHVTINLKAKRANVMALSGDYSSAKVELNEVIQARYQILGEAHPDTFQSIRDLSIVCQQTQDFDGAVKWATIGIGVAEELYGAESEEYATQKNNLGVVFYAAEDFGRAIRELTAACEIRKRLLGPDSAEAGHSSLNLGMALLGDSQLDQAEEAIMASLEIFESDPSLFGPLAQAHIQLGTLQMVRSAFPLAEAEFREARRVLDPHREAAPVEFAEACFKLGVSLGKQGKYPSAEIQLREALDIQRDVLPVGHPQRSQTEAIYSLVQGKLNEIRTGQVPGGVRR